MVRGVRRDCEQVVAATDGGYYYYIIGQNNVYEIQTAMQLSKSSLIHSFAPTQFRYVTLPSYSKATLQVSLWSIGDPHLVLVELELVLRLVKRLHRANSQPNRAKQHTHHNEILLHRPKCHADLRKGHDHAEQLQ